jgi:hypothetical protein
MAEDSNIPVGLIIALVIVGVMVLMLGGFFSTLLFGGPELKASKTVAETINSACEADSSFFTTFNIYLPNSKFTGSHIVYYYIAVTPDYQLLLREKREARDIIAQFADFVTQQPGERTVKSFDLDKCRYKNTRICGIFGDKPEDIICGNFAFESNEGQESLNFMINRTASNTVVLSYAREESP